MLQNLAIWVRAVHPTPTDDFIIKRTSAAKELIAFLLSGGIGPSLLECISGAALGFENEFQRKLAIAAKANECIRNHQISFPSDILESALEIRIACSIAVGELMCNESDNAATNLALVTAGIFLASVGMRSDMQEKHLQAVMHGLTGKAREVLFGSGAEARRRTEFSFEEFDKVDATTLALIRQNLIPLIKSTFVALQRQSLADREELQGLWWLSGRSSKEGKPFSQLKRGFLPLCCGIEFADFLILPPVRSAHDILRQAIRSTPGSDGSVDLLTLVSDWESEQANQLGSMAHDLVRAYPALFPLSWIATRIKESGSHSGWEKEFTNRAGIQSGREDSLEKWAQQVFNERIAQRLWISRGGKV